MPLTPSVFMVGMPRDVGMDVMRWCVCAFFKVKHLRLWFEEIGQHYTFCKLRMIFGVGGTCCYMHGPREEYGSLT